MNLWRLICRTGTGKESGKATLLKTAPVPAAVRGVEIVEASTISITRDVGPDRVTVSGGRVVIDARREFPDWQVREFARIPVHFEGQRYFLSARFDGAPPWRVRYVLDPWPANLGPGNGRFLVYDADAVAERDMEVRDRRANEAVHLSLLLVAPLMGFLWSGTKQRLARFGFIPRTVTGLSLLLTFGLLLLQGALGTIFMMAGGMSGQEALGGLVRAFFGDEWAWIDPLLLVALAVDCLLRYGQHLNHTEEPWGFMEWLAAPFTKWKAKR